MDYSVLKIASSVFMAFVACTVFAQAITKSRHKQFYADTPWLIPFGVYVWGDALVMAPFWFMGSILFLFLSPIGVLRFILFFLLVRACYETVYWLVHQSSSRTFIPPLLRKISWIGSNEAAILYQLLNTAWVILFGYLLMLTFVGV